MKIAIAGASGFIGRSLISELGNENEIIALGRTVKESDNRNIKWVKSDLFSYESIKKALHQVDVAIYLVHSMMPSSRLFQGNFQDTDLLLADNFAKACEEQGVRQIIYVGGPIPEGEASNHLKSRNEVEEVFEKTGINLTVLRAGLVVGEGGTSFEILRNLVLNLPAMVLPKWTQSRTQVIYIDDLIRVLKKSIWNQDFWYRDISVVNGESLSYRDLIEQTANYYDKERIFIPVPVNYTSFSKLWVKIFGESDYELVSPLIDSLICNLPNPPIDPVIEDCIENRTYKKMLTRISRKKRKRTKNKLIHGNTVRSIQRLENPNKFSIQEISENYIEWLPTYLKSLIKAVRLENRVEFKLFGFPLPLLILEQANEGPEVDCIKYNITGGLLVQKPREGQLEFRQVVGGKYSLVCINEFTPSIPWPIYVMTQAPFHAHVMRSFGKYLKKKGR